MDLYEWDRDNVPLGPCDEGPAEDCYIERINSALGGDVHMAANLLRFASMYLSKGKPMPEPLVDYLVKVLDEAAHEGLNIPPRSGAAKRATKIVKALHLNHKHTARHKSKEELKRNMEVFNAMTCMYEQITHGDIPKYAAARQAAKQYPGAVKSISNNDSAENDSRIKAYISLYERERSGIALMAEELDTFLRDID